MYHVVLLVYAMGLGYGHELDCWAGINSKYNENKVPVKDLYLTLCVIYPTPIAAPYLCDWWLKSAHPGIKLCNQNQAAQRQN